MKNPVWGALLLAGFSWQVFLHLGDAGESFLYADVPESKAHEETVIRITAAKNINCFFI